MLTDSADGQTTVEDLELALQDATDQFASAQTGVENAESLYQDQNTILAGYETQVDATTQALTAAHDNLAAVQEATSSRQRSWPEYQASLDAMRDVESQLNPP